MRIKLALVLMACIGMVMSGCSSNSSNPSVPLTQASAAPKGVYTMTNDSAGNKIAFYLRQADGSLTYVNSYPTGGKGSGDVSPLRSQGSLVFNPDLNLFFCVNAGDGTTEGTVSALRLNDDGSLTLLDTVDSGGIFPVSLTQSSQSLYVVNWGDGTQAHPANITGFSVGPSGLAAITHSTQPLSVYDAQPAEVSLTPGGGAVVVTEKANSMIDVFGLDNNGLLKAGNFQASNGSQPYGFAFGPNGHLLVAETDGADPHGALSSYSVDTTSGDLSSISASVDSGGWRSARVTVAGDFAYVSSISSGSVSRYQIGTDGGLTFEDVASMSAGAGDEPDGGALDATDGGKFLYVHNVADDSIDYFKINSDGSLGPLNVYDTNVPLRAEGLVAR